MWEEGNRRACLVDVPLRAVVEDAQLEQPFNGHEMRKILSIYKSLARTKHIHTFRLHALHQVVYLFRLFGGPAARKGKCSGDVCCIPVPLCSSIQAHQLSIPKVLIVLNIVQDCSVRSRSRIGSARHFIVSHSRMLDFTMRVAA
ncbi:hypothetical protein KCU61_g451, partial [Aureobasidium melanogenum]